MSDTLNLTELGIYLTGRYENLLELRQFHNRAQLREALQPGAVFWRTLALFCKPYAISDMNLVLEQTMMDEWPAIVCRPVLTRTDTIILRVRDLQPFLPQGVFSEEHLARAYFAKMQRIYDFDPVWQKSATALRAAHASNVKV